MTPAMERCWAAYCLLANGRAPTMPEMRNALGGIKGPSVQRTLDRLTIAGFNVPLSAVAWRDRAGQMLRPARVHAVSGQQIQARRMIELLRRADRLVSRYGDAEDCEWADFRREAQAYLE